MIKAVLFDLDLTLWNSGNPPADWAEITSLQAEQLAPIFDRLGLTGFDHSEFVRRFWQNYSEMDAIPNPTLREIGGAEVIAATLSDLGAPCSASQGECLWEGIHIPFNHFNIHPYGDTMGCLEALRNAGFRLAIISNRPQSAALLSREFGALGIPDVFDAIFTSGDIGFRKPHPLIFETALRHLEVKPHQTIVIGDSYDNDIAPAAALGIQAVLKLNDREPDAAWSSASHQVASLAALLELPYFEGVVPTNP